LDHLPGGRSVELHPRLTVLLGASADFRAELARILRAIVTGEPVDADGQVELHGVIVGLRNRGFDVGSAAPVDPILDLTAPTPLRASGTPAPPRPPGPGPRPPLPEPEGGSVEDSRAVHPGPGDGRPVVEIRSIEDHLAPEPPDPAHRTRQIANDELVRLRAELRALDGERAILARSADEVRVDLDSFARATLDVALGQLEAVEGRRRSAVTERIAWDAEHEARRAELVASIGRLREDLSAMPPADLDPLRRALDHLRSVRVPSRRPDPTCRGLAVELEDLRRSMEALETRRLEVEESLSDALEQMTEAEAELELARDSIRAPELHPAVVRQLEAVRDEIFELEERGGRVAAVRHRRRIDELRTEEALLLDQLGFDTYTAFVMGRPNRETESVRAIREDRARSRLDQLTEEVDRLRQELPGGTEDVWNRDERDRVVDAAAEHLGTPADGLRRLTTPELIELLQSQVERPSPTASAEILTASGRVAAALVAAGAPAPAAVADPEAMNDVAEAWLADEPARLARREALVSELEQAEGELEAYEGSRRADDGGRLADLDAELRALQARVAAGEEAVARHERATAELAELRSRELDLRDRERDLLVRISDRERLLEVLGGDGPPGATSLPPQMPELPPVPSTGSWVARTPEVMADEARPDDAAEAVQRVVRRDAAVVWPVDCEWQLLARLGEVRSLGMVGSVPLLVHGIDAASVETPALLHRIASMSELVQTIVLSDDERLGRWCDGLDVDARLLRWSS
ncbi:MAG TPA: hypothetical protein PKE05_15180, partial [Microthrixaceae bacterium]|nr:hypothetical protein [Microthrixaceae bacterium]